MLHKAFPGGRSQAMADGERWCREYALGVVTRVNELRNRVAHHELLINGMPLNGQAQRRSACEMNEDVPRLAPLLDRALRSYLEKSSAVPRVMKGRP